MTSLTPSQYAACADALAQTIRDGGNAVTALDVTVDLRKLPAWPEYVKLREAYNRARQRPRSRKRIICPRRERPRPLGRRFLIAQIQLQEEFMEKVAEQVAE